MQDSVQDRIKKIVIETNSSSAVLIKTGNEKIIEDLEFDSLSIMMLLEKVETEFNIIFDEEMIFIDNFYTINSLSEYVEKIMVKKDE